MHLEVGDKVIYPNTGVGVVQNIQAREIGGEQQDFYCLRLIENDSTVMVPTQNADEVGIRKIIEKDGVDKVYHILSDGQITTHKSWKGRYQQNADRLRSGSIYEVAEVVKSLLFLKTKKDLSYREKKMLEKATYLLVSEIKEVEVCSTDDVETRIEHAVKKSIRTREQ